MKLFNTIRLLLSDSERMRKAQAGQTLITLLVFMMIGITIVSAGTIVLAAGMLSTTTSEQGQRAYDLAESGAEDGVLHMLRNPLYSGTYQPVPVADGTVTVTVSGNTIISTGKSGNVIRKIKVDTARTSGVLQITSWKEIQ